MKDNQTKTPNKRKSFANGDRKTPNQSPKNKKGNLSQSFTGQKFTPKTDKKQGNFNKKTPNTAWQQRTQKQKGDKRKSLPAKLFNGDDEPSPKKLKLQKFKGTGDLTAVNEDFSSKIKQEQIPKTPKKEAVVIKQEKIDASPKKVTPKKENEIGQVVSVGAKNKTPKQANAIKIKQEKEEIAATPVKVENKEVAKVDGASSKKKRKQKTPAGSPKEKTPQKQNATPKKEDKSEETANGVLSKRQKKRLILKEKRKRQRDNVKQIKIEIASGKLENHSTLEKISNKIADLEAKPELTKTGKRNLKHFKRLLLLCGKKNDKPEKVDKPAVEGKILTKAEKRRLRRERKLQEKTVAQKSENEMWTKELATTQKEEKANKKQQVKQENVAKNQGKNKQNVKQNLPIIKKENIKAEEDSDSEESDYDVEKVIKVDKIAKKMNEPEDASDDNEEAEGEESDDEEVEEASADEEDGEEESDDDEENDESEEEEIVEEPKPKKGKFEKPQEQKGKNAKQPLDKGKNKQEKQGGKPKQDKEIKVDELKDKGFIQKGQTRYVVFVGNIPYDTKKEELQEHFQKAGDIAHIRIPTEKGSQRPRGFAYVELKNEESYQRALSLHNSFVKGRKINVLYTQGGKKKPEEKKKEIKAKNFKLQAMRQQGMLAGSVKESQKRSMRRTKKKNFEKNQSE